MSKFYTYLQEASYTVSDIPEYFYVVFELRDKNALEGLKKGKFEGMRGISDTGEIVFQWLGVARDAYLRMDAKEVLKLNKVTRIMYDNPHYLVSNGMWALKRIFNSMSRNWYNQIFSNIMQYTKKELSKDKDKYFNILYQWDFNGVSNIGFDVDKSKADKINSLKDLTHFLDFELRKWWEKKAWGDYDLSKEELKKYLVKALKEIGRTYSDEGEWVIKNSGLRIPKGSDLLVTIPDVDASQEVLDWFKDYYKQNDKELETLDILGGEYPEFIKEWAKTTPIYVKDNMKRYVKKKEIINSLKGKYLIKELSNSDWEKMKRNWTRERYG